MKDTDQPKDQVKACGAKPGRVEFWQKAGGRRRLVLLILVIGPAILSSHIMFTLLPKGLWGMNLLASILFAILFAWISVGFWSSVAGMAVMLKRYDRFKVTFDLPEKIEIGSGFRTALLFPVYNEDMTKVAEGIRATWHSLRAKGLDDHFDVFILSDSTNPDVWVAEEEAWHELCRRENLFDRLFYRHRKLNLKRKSGNIADFCRRWGAYYKYMVVFDADSIMAGETVGRMVQAMEARPDIGILQSPPKAILSRSLLARVQQFANHLYGPVFAAGLHFWQLGDAQYWGHNAIIRVEPFIRHCQLPKLPGKGPLGGEILSHDFVESALMRRAGYGVWLAYELGGSYEQNPPNLIDELARDRRWCQGNLQHGRLIFTQGFFPTHRALFINGIMSYGSALLWLFFLLVSSAQALGALFVTPDYFPQGRPSLFPDWPQYFPVWALTILSGTAALLFLPKLLAVMLVTGKGGAKAFGGVGPMCLSVLLEVIISTFLAPVRMLFHSFFVATTLLGAKVGWNAQNRDDSGTLWSEAIRCHWWGTLFGLVWGALMLFFSPGFFIWLSPVTAGLALSIPLSVWTSRISLGLAAGRAGLLLTPAETAPPPELLEYQRNLEESQSRRALPEIKGFARAVAVPAVFALHRLLSNNKRRKSASQTARLEKLAERALNQGPSSLKPKEKAALLNAPDVLTDLHRRVWSLDEKRAALWGIK